jgi:hypothetical protein
LNLMWQICCTQKLDLQTWIGGIPCTSMWWIFHIHVADLIYSKLHMIWFTQNSTWSDLLKTLRNKHGLRIHGCGDFYSIWFWLTLPVAKGRERLWNLQFSFILCPTFWGVFIHQVWLCKLWLRSLLLRISLNM